MVSWYTTITATAECVEPACQKAIEVTGATWTEIVRKLRAAGWAVTPGDPREWYVVRCPDHHRRRKDVTT